MGFYVDNRKNRILGRVGQIFDRGERLKQELLRMARGEREGLKIDNEPTFRGRIDTIPEKLPRRKFTEKEDELLIQQRKQGIPYLNIANLLLRSVRSVSNRLYRLRKKGISI